MSIYFMWEMDKKNSCALSMVVHRTDSAQWGIMGRDFLPENVFLCVAMATPLCHCLAELLPGIPWGRSLRL